MMIRTITKAKSYLRTRHAMVQRAMKDLSVDSMLLTDRSDIAYLTDFAAQDAVGLISPKGMHLITDFRYQAQAATEASWLDLVIADADIPGVVAKTLVQAGSSRVAYDANHLTVGQLKALEHALQAHVPSCPVQLIPHENLLAHLRKVKDDHEIELIRRAVAVAEEAFEAVRAAVKVGLTENYLAGLMILELRSRGADDASFPVMVASGAPSALPHYQPGEALVQRDQPLLLDWGATYRGYCCDLTRTLMVGQVSERIRRAYKVVLESQAEALRVIRPGVTNRQVDQAAREVVGKYGLGQYFGHGLGHGIGRDVHELPALRTTAAEEELRPGMVVAIEPGVYLPGEGGVRLEDIVLVTHSGCEVLSNLPKAWEDVQIL